MDPFLALQTFLVHLSTATPPNYLYPFKLHVTSLQIVSEKHTIYHAKQGTIEIFILMK